MHTVLEVVGPAQEVVAQFGEVLRRHVIETDHKQRIVDDLQARLVVVVIGERAPQARPDLAVLCRENANRVAGHFVQRQLLGIVYDGLKVSKDFLFGQDRPVLSIEDVEPVCKPS